MDKQFATLIAALAACRQELAEARREIEAWKKGFGDISQKCNENAEDLGIAEREVDRLRAEVEQLKPKRGNGRILIGGHYWIKIPQGWMMDYRSKYWRNPDRMEWVGPIEPPKEGK